MIISLIPISNHIPKCNLNNLGQMETAVSSSDSIDGGEDVFSSKQSDVSSADHLVVMVHGILGRSVFQLHFILFVI